jgi:rRNA-processing protein FCF1
MYITDDPRQENQNNMNPFRRRPDQVQSVVLDTSGIIDGRIIEIAKAGFVPQSVVVPQFVIAELQFLADHGDTHKRERARYGLDIIRELQDVRGIEVSISREKFEHIREVDDKLVALAKQYGAYLYTTDFNLNKVAQIEGVNVLNVNELAHALRPNLLPGERVSIKLTQVGQDKTQGVGYLGDGTMVVVEQASRYVGQQVQATCTRILQTQAGKMMFATLANAPAPQESRARDQKPQQPAEQAQSAPQKPAAGEGTSRRRRGSRGGQNRSNDKPAQTQDQPQAQAPQAQQPAQQKPARQQPQRQPRQQQPAAKQPTQRRAPNKRRISPEDSLLATLSELDNNK